MRVLFLQVRALLEHQDIDVNRRNNDRLTSFMLAMQSSNLHPTVSSTSSAVSHAGSSRGSGGANPFLRSVSRSDNSNVSGSSSEVTRATGPHRHEENAQEKLRRLMDLPATDDLDWTRQDR